MRRLFSTALAFVAFAQLVPAGEGTVEGPVITLEQAYDLALESDQSIAKAYWEIRKANLEPLSALTRLGPNVSLTGSLARSRQRTRGTSSSSSSDLGELDSPSSREVRTTTTLTTSGDVGIQYSQTLLDLTALPAYRLGKLTAEAARLTYKSTTREVLFGLAQAYYEVLKQERVVEVGQQSVTLAQEQLDLAEKRLNAGEAVRSDVLRAQVSVENARRDLLQAQNDLASAHNTLGNILNIGGDTPFRVSEPPAYGADAPAYDDLQARARQRREDLRAAGVAISQDVERRNEIRAQYWPRISTQLNAGLNDTSGDRDSSGHNIDASINVEVPIFTGGQREIDLRQAAFQINQTQLDYEIKLKDVQQEVKDAWLDARTFRQSLEALRAQVTAAEQAYQDLRTQFQAGTSTSVDVLSALNELNVARRDLATETYDYQVALRNLEQTTGVFQEDRVNKLKFK
jgi:outer membrane protein